MGRSKAKKKKTTTHHKDSNTAFVRIHPIVRDRLRRFCLRRHLSMGGLATSVLDAYMRHTEAHETRNKNKKPAKVEATA